MTERPKVLLLGDSIRMSYQPVVAETMSGEAVVVGPAENCQFSLYTLSSIDRWLETLGTPRVVHWNNGIHDAGHNPWRRPIQIPCDDYAGNLKIILDRLRQTEAKIIWASSTPVHPDRPYDDTQWVWRNEELDRYNAAALELMNTEGVPVNDLHTLVAADHDRYLAEDQLHLSEEGVAMCAAAVVKAVRAALG